MRLLAAAALVALIVTVVTRASPADVVVFTDKFPDASDEHPPPLPNQYYAKLVVSILDMSEQLAAKQKAANPDVDYREVGQLSLCDFWFDGVHGRALSQCTEQQAIARGARGHAWTTILYANKTQLTFYPGDRSCWVTHDSDILPYAIFDPRVPEVFDSHKTELVDGIEDAATYYAFVGSLSFSFSARYAVTKEGVPISFEYGPGNRGEPPALNFLRADFLSFTPGGQVRDEQYNWPSYCHDPAQSA